MTLNADSFGDIADVLRALGLANADGSINEAWLSAPGDYLKDVLAAPHQRAALLKLLDERLEGDKEIDAEGRIWLPIVATPAGEATFFFVIDEAPPTEVRIGLGVRIATTGPDSRTSFLLPLFRAGKGSHGIGDPILIGHAGGVLVLTSELVVDPAPPPTGAALGAVGLSFRVPTAAADGPPTIALTLGGLRLPGMAAARDLALSVSDIDELDDAAIELILGLIEAQAEGGATAQVVALAELLGLRGSVPALPIEQLATQGPAALSAWFASVIGTPAAKAAWLAALSDLIGSAASVAGATLTIDLGSTSIGIEVFTTMGPTGRPIVIPRLSFGATQGDARAEVAAELVRIDLGTGDAIAFPSLSADIRIGTAASPLLTGDPAARTLRAGLALSETREPVAVLALDEVQIGANSYPTLDLSSPDAIAETATTILSDVIAGLLAQLGSPGQGISVLLGIAPPASAPALPTIDLAAFLANPLGAVRAHWRTLLVSHAPSVPAVLAELRGLLADASVATDAVTGSGSPVDPWRIRLVGPASILVRLVAPDMVELALGLTTSQSDLGQRCTILEGSFDLALLRTDLAAGSAAFAPGLAIRLDARSRGSRRTALGSEPMRLETDRVSATVTWTAEAGIRFALAAPNPALIVQEVAIPLDIPDFDQGFGALTPSQWDAIETLLGLLADAVAKGWLKDLVQALGWRPATLISEDPDRLRLRLADLAAEPQAALRAWIGRLLVDGAGKLQTALQPLARVFSGTRASFGQVVGSGHPDDPFRIPVAPLLGGPAIAVWVEPDGVPRGAADAVGQPLRAWRPGREGLDPFTLARSILTERAEAEGTADAALRIDALRFGIEALLARWNGTDGRIAPPANLPAGVVSTVREGVAEAGLRDAVDLANLLGTLPATRLHIAVARESDGWPFPAAPEAARIDLRPANRAPETFAAPTPAAGDWFIALAPRADAALAVGDPDGALGQAARLQRVFAAFSTAAGDVAAIADAASSHAAWIAAEAVGAARINKLVALGMALQPVSFSILDLEPGAGAFRLLRGLLPPLDAAEPDDPDLAVGRALIGALADLTRLPNPAGELSPPATLPAAVGAGLAVRAIYGRFQTDAILRGLSAIAAAGLSVRAVARAVLKDAAGVTGAGIGIAVPITAETDGITVSGHVTADLLGITLSPDPTLSDSRAIRAHLELRRAGGWLLGGPGSGTGAAHELRWLEINAAVPVTGTGAAYAEITLHDARVFGIFRDSWTLKEAGAAAAEGVATTALPEVRVLLSSLVAELLADTSPRIAGLADLLRGLGIVDGSDGLVAAALDRFLHEPAAQVADVLADPARVLDLQDAIDGLLDTVPGLDADIISRTLSLTLTGASPVVGVPEWAVSASIAPTGTAAAALSLGTLATGRLSLAAAPLAVTFDWQPPGSAPVSIPIWPNPDPASVVEHAPEVVTSSAISFALDYMRTLDAGARPVIDALLDVLHLLAPPEADGTRRIRPPLALLRDPVGWLTSAEVLGRSGGGFDATRVVALVDAIRPFLGVPGAAGRWDLATGIAVRAVGTGGEVDLALELDSTAFAGGADALAFGGSIGLRVGAAAPLPVANVFVGLPGAAVPGRSAAHLVVGGGVRLFVRPSTGADLPLFPDPPGLGSLVGAAVDTALPLVLNAVVADGGRAGTLTAAIGDALGLREGSPPAFTAPLLRSWADDPATQLALRWPAMSATALNALASALAGALPAGIAATATAGGISVGAGPLTLGLATGPFRFSVGYADTGLPFVGAVAADIAFDASGLHSHTATLGPAVVSAGGTDLLPLFTIAVGNSVPTPSVGLGLALASDGAQSLVLRALFDPLRFEVAFDDGSAPTTDPASVAAGLLTVTLGMLADFLRQATGVQQLLAKPVPGSGGSTVEDLLEGVMLRDGDTTRIDTAFFRLIPTPDQTPDQILASFKARFVRLVDNFALAAPSTTIDGKLTVGLGKSSGSVGITVGLADRLPLTAGDVVVSLENDNRWIIGAPPAGITLGILTTAPSLDFRPSISVNGLGVRIGRNNAPLLDAGFSLGSVALHFFGRVGSGPLAGGVQIQLSDLAVGVSGATGGNPVASGIMGETGGQDQELAPAFSPALAVQKDGSGPVKVSLSAGDGDGPWFLSIRKGFGPLYVEQVGLGVTVNQDQLQKISLFFDGRISIVGLTAAVDDLQLTYTVASGPFYDPASWKVDLAGLAVSADISGVTLSGGLRKYTDPARPEDVEYIGMLMARFAAYGLSIYGGYASISVEPDGRFTAFFAYGAVVGPFGGPPAFFLTGIGGGFGINREIVPPTDLGKFGDFVMIKALDPAASAPSDPLAEMDGVRASFPAKQGQFWFAAGISFTSFAIVDGIAVVAVEFGKGFELNIFGLARLALPRPQIALVSIELGLIARFSTEEGVIWIQAQLTDNSWLLHESVRLTGGFAFVSWFGGPNKGQFVLTLGGYHPSFSRDGYPTVPRLGFNWQPISNIVIKGENYFALTSEAVMAGGALEASATFGPAWAHVSFAANVIIYFDPFRYQADVSARIAAGVTVDFWLGEVTFEISISARIEVEGPEFHGKVTFEVGPIELMVEFGGKSQSSDTYIAWSEFVTKYLEDAGGGRARVLSSLTGLGSLPPGNKAGNGGEGGTADGSALHPYEVLSEFEMLVTTTAPTDRLKLGAAADQSFATSLPLGLPPLNASLSVSRLTLSLKKVGVATERINASGITVTARQTGNFPAAVWGPPQDPDNKKVPKGEVIAAVEGAHMVTTAALVNRIPTEIAFNQVEAGPRKPLPFVHESTARPTYLAEAQGLRDVMPGGLGEAEMFALSQNWLERAGAGATLLAARERARVAPSRVGTLGERLLAPAPEVKGGVFPPAPPVVFDRRVLPPKAVGLLATPLRVDDLPLRTTVSRTAAAVRMPAPTLAGIEARFAGAVPFRLERVGAAGAAKETLVGVSRTPVTQGARANAAFVRGLGEDTATDARLSGIEIAAAGPARTASAPAEASLLPGEIAIYDMPNARRAATDASSGTVMIAGAASVTLLGLGGAPLAAAPDPGGSLKLPPSVARIVVRALGKVPDKTGVRGWLAEQDVAYVGWSTALFDGGLLSVDGAAIRRGPERAAGVGWMRAADLARSGAAATRFDAFAPTLAILVDGPVGDDDIDDFVITLDDALDAGDAPIVVGIGGRSALVFRLAPKRRQGGPYTVRFDSGASARLAGVLAARGSPDELAASLAARGPEDVIAQPVQGAGEPARIRWTAPVEERM